MPTYLEKIQPPSDDKRWNMVAATMKKLGNRPSALIEALHTLQQVFGYLDKPGLTFVAAVLKVPPSQVYGAATFYHYFTLKPQGEHSCTVCTGTACYIKGSTALLESIEARTGLKPGETSPDGRLSVLTARCFGTCGLAPAAVIDGEMESWLTPQSLQEHLEGIGIHAV
jgi:bidirectional [NiFe] hydrogenase diaphorase subunit